MSSDPGFAAVTSLLREVVLRLERIETAIDRHAARPVSADAKDRLWTVAEVAEFLGRSTRSVYQLASDGTLPVLRVGGHLRFVPEAVKAWAVKGAH